MFVQGYMELDTLSSIIYSWLYHVHSGSIRPHPSGASALGIRCNKKLVMYTIQISYDWEAGKGLGFQIGLRVPIQFKCGFKLTVGV